MLPALHSCLLMNARLFCVTPEHAQVSASSPDRLTLRTLQHGTKIYFPWTAALRWQSCRLAHGRAVLTLQ